MQSYFGTLSGNNGSLGLLDESRVVDSGDRSLDISSHLSQIGLQNASPVPHHHDQANISLQPQHEIFTDEEDLFFCGRCKQQFTDLQVFLHHKREECIGRPQGLQCPGQNMQVMHVQQHPPTLQQPHGQVAAGTGPRVLFGQNHQDMVSRSQEPHPMMINTTQCSSHGVENSTGLNLTQGPPKGHDLSAPSMRTGMNHMHALTCEPPQQHISINQMGTLLHENQYQNSGVIQSSMGSISSSTENVLSEDMLMNSAATQADFDSDSQLARLQQNEANSQQFHSLSVGITGNGGMPSFLQQIPPLQNVQHNVPEMHENQQVLIQMSQQPQMHPQQNGSNLGLNFSSVSLAPFTVPPTNTSYVVQYEQPPATNTVQNLSKLPAIAPRPEGAMLVDQTPVVEPECPENANISEPVEMQNDDNAVTKTQNNPKKKFVCQYCSKAFSRGFDLEQHIRSHTGEKPFQCIVCGRAFSQKSNVKKHMSTHKVWPKHALEDLPKIVIVQGPAKEKDQEDKDDTEEAKAASSAEKSATVTTSTKMNNTGAYKNALAIMSTSIHTCPYCFQVLSSYKERKSHMLQHKDKQVYKCVMETCDKTFPDLDTYVEHVKMHEGNMTYRCHHCHKVFNTLHNLGVHQYQAHLNAKSKVGKYPRLYSCSLCPAKFSHPELLRKHMSTESHDHLCSVCQKQFSCERYLRKHLVLVHSDNEKNNVKCSVCQVSLKSVYYLRYHMLIHTKEKPFKCNQCNSEFNRKDKLKRHMLLHDPVKKFKCPLRDVLGCDKEFSRPDKLKAHIIRHGGVRNHRCSYCPKAYSRRCFKIAHERTHTDEFRCARCKKGFESSQRLSSHKCKPNTNADEPGTSSGVPKSRRPRSATKRLRNGNRKKMLEATKTTPDGVAEDVAVAKQPSSSTPITLPEGPMYAIRSGSKRLRNKARLNFRKTVAATRRKELGRSKLAAVKATKASRGLQFSSSGKINVEIEVQEGVLPSGVAEDEEEDSDVDVETEDASSASVLKTLVATSTAN